MKAFNSRENASWLQTPNTFSDKTFAEWQDIVKEVNEDEKGIDDGVEKFKFTDDDNEAVPDDLSWTNITGVFLPKIQGKCACSYAAAAVKAVEMNYLIRTGKRVHLSMQEVIDCSGDKSAKISDQKM